MAEYSDMAIVALCVGAYAVSVVVALLCVGVYRWFRPRSPSLHDDTDDIVGLCIVWPIALMVACLVWPITFMTQQAERFIDKCNSAGMRRLRVKREKELQDDE